MPAARAWDSAFRSHILRPTFRRQNPDTTFPWAQVEPLSYDFSFDSRNKLPYSEDYEFSVQRQFGSNTVLTASYVGNEGHRLVTSIEANPANQAECLFLNNPANLAPNSAGRAVRSARLRRSR